MLPRRLSLRKLKMGQIVAFSRGETWTSLLVGAS
jgi:hypothetical protein